MNINYKISVFSIKYFFCTLMAMFCIMSCGSDDEPQDEETMNVDCSGEASFVLDGEVFNFGTPLSAEFRFNEAFDKHEFLVAWAGNDGNLGVQVLIDLDGAGCFEPNQIIDLNDLPSTISVMSLQFNSLSQSVNASPILDDVTGLIEITSCDEANKVVSFNFQFSGPGLLGGDTKVITQGKATNVCFIFT